MSQLNRYFIYKCEKGLKERGLSDKQEYVDRLKFEMDTIIRMGFTGYFLVTQDFIFWAKNNNILVGCARGSAGGCLVSYCLKITELDPIRWDLLFERFLNPDRISNPDIDLDFPNKKRQLVLDYVVQKYGEDSIAHIGTFGTMKAKSSVKDVCRVLGEPITMGEKLSKMLLAPISGKPQSLKESFNKVAELNKIYNSDTREGTVLRWAEKIEDLKKSASVHPCGIVIGDKSIRETIPLFKSRHGETTTQWDMDNIEDVGYIKFDFLGVEALDKIEVCLDIIKDRHGISIDIDNIPLDDEKVFSELRQGNTVGIFQMEGSAGIRDLLVRVQPTSIEDIIATTCLFRPGPLSSGYSDIYVNVKNGIQEPQYIIPELEPILEKTYSVFIYQETVMNIAKKLCGYTGGQADELRKAIGKKKQKLMDKHEKLFKDGWVNNGYPAAGANKLWQDINNCAAYLFNRTVDKNTKVATLDGIKRIEDCSSEDTVYTMDSRGEITESKVEALHDHGTVPLWEVEFNDGTIEKCTLDHKWATEWGQQPLWKILDLDCEVWGTTKNQKEDVCSSKTMQYLCQSEVRKWTKKRLDMSWLQEDLQNSNETTTAPEDLQTLSRNTSKNQRKKTSLWVESQNLTERSTKTQTDLPKMQRNPQTDQNKDSKICNLYPKIKKTTFRSSKKNISKTRNPSSKSSCVSQVEERKSRETLRNMEESLCEPQKIENGSLVRTSPMQTWIHTEYQDSMWERPQTGGFYQQRAPGNPRGGWTVALYSGSWKRCTTKNPEQGSDARHRNIAKRMATSQDLYGELQSLRRTYEGKLREPLRYTYKPKAPTSGIYRKVVRVSYLGMQQGYDLEVNHPDHNFLLASGLCCSNSHGAGYSMITYQTAYLKANYPTEYICAVMFCIGKKKKDHLIRCLTECKRLGIKVDPPDINESKDGFSMIGDKYIRFGLGPIKNVGAAADTILEERKMGGPFTSIRNFYERVDMRVVNRLKFESLIRAGSFDKFGYNRATLLGTVEKIWKYRDEMKKYKKKVDTYNKKEENRLERLKEREEGSKKKPLKVWPKPEEPQWPDIVEMDELSDSDIHTIEHELLGFFVSSHPLDNIKQSDDLNTIDEMQDMGNDQQVIFAGIITNLKEITTKVKKQKMAFALVEDLTGSIETTIFSGVYNKINHLLDEKKPLLIRGNLDITETDEGDKTVKVRVTNITLLDLNIDINSPDIIETCVPVLRANEYLRLLDKYAGDLHEVKNPAFMLSDGTKIRFPIRPFIGNHKGIFMKEVTRLKNGETQ